MHNNSALRRFAGDGAVVVSGLVPTASTARDSRRTDASNFARQGTSTSLRARLAQPADALGIATLISRYTADGSLLPRSASDVLNAIDSYVVVTAPDGAVLACAALTEYSPSLAEVASVAVAPAAQGHGLGSIVVRAVERLARVRGHRELFALSLADHFFSHLGYRAATLERFPEKRARYAMLTASGATLVEKRVFRKRLRAPRAFPHVANNTNLVSAPTVYHAKPARG